MTEHKRKRLEHFANRIEELYEPITPILKNLDSLERQSQEEVYGDFKIYLKTRKRYEVIRYNLYNVYWKELYEIHKLEYILEKENYKGDRYLWMEN